MSNELNHLENYEEFSGLVHEKGTSSDTLTTNQFLEQLKIENPRGIFSGTIEMPTTSDIIDVSMSVASSFVDEYKSLYGEPFYCGSAYVQTPKKSDFGKQLKKLKLGFDSYDGYIHVPLRIMYQSLDLSMLGAEIQKAILEGYGITDLSIGYYSD